MKLPIKKKYFDQIKSGKKDIEWRDAHITFVCEETGRTLKKNVIEVEIEKTSNINFGKKELEMFDDTHVIGFGLED